MSKAGKSGMRFGTGKKDGAKELVLREVMVSFRTKGENVIVDFILFSHSGGGKKNKV